MAMVFIFNFFYKFHSLYCLIIAKIFELMISEIEKSLNPNGEESGGCTIL